MFGLPIWAVRVVGYAALVLVIFAAGARIMSQLDAGKIATYKAHEAAQAAAGRQVQAVQKTLTVADTKSEAVAQQTLAAQAKVIIKRIPVYVSASPSPPTGCVTWGMLRLHDAAVLGVDPASLEPPAGQPDSACSAVAPSVFMAGVADNYAAARANAEQLDALIADVAARGQAITAPDVSPSPGAVAP